MFRFSIITISALIATTNSLLVHANDSDGGDNAINRRNLRSSIKGMSSGSPLNDVVPDDTIVPEPIFSSSFKQDEHIDDPTTIENYQSVAEEYYNDKMNSTGLPEVGEEEEHRRLQTYHTIEGRIGHPTTCIDLSWGNTNNGNTVILYRCHGGSNQLWNVGRDGYIRSAVNKNKCLDFGPRGGLYDKAFIWDCGQGDHQKFDVERSGFQTYRLRNRRFRNRYIGTAYCRENNGARLELRNKESSGDCSKAQEWKNLFSRF